MRAKNGKMRKRPIESNERRKSKIKGIGTIYYADGAEEEEEDGKYCP